MRAIVHASIGLVLLISSSANAQSVLVYGTLPSGELPWYSGFPSMVITTVTEAQWQAMTQAQFGMFDLIWIGGINNINSSPAPYTVLNNTKANWAPAVNGLIVVDCIHIASTIHPQVGGMNFVNSTITWLLTGGGTALYVGQDVGLAGFNFLSQWNVIGCSGLNCFNVDTVVFPIPGHPVLAGTTEMSLSGWNQSVHNRITAAPADWTVVATGPGGQILVLCREFSCNVHAPASTPISGIAPMEFDIFEPGGNPVTVTFQYSTDGGISYQNASVGAGSPIAMNPQSIQPGLDLEFWWDTVADLGTGGPYLITFRILVNSAMRMAQCERNIPVDNRMGLPVCNITAPAAAATKSGTFAVGFTADSPTGSAMTALVQYSTDGGASFQNATGAAGGTLTGSPTGSFFAGAYTWNWNSRADLTGDSYGVTIRVAITEVNPPNQMTTCQVIIDVENGIHCNITNPTPFAQVTGPQLINFTTMVPTFGGLVASFDYSTDSGVTFMPATNNTMIGGSVVGNPTPVFLAGLPQSWGWNSATDLPGMATVLFRVRITDNLNPMVTTTCEVSVNVDQNPCAMAQYACGDCDGDHFVTILDAYRMAMISSGRSPTPSYGSELYNACNVWGVSSRSLQSEISIMDSLEAARYVVGLTLLTCCTP